MLLKKPEPKRRQKRLQSPDLGARYGRLVVTGKVQYHPEQTGRFVPVRCDCGEERVVKLSKLEAGTTTSCGCARSDRFTEFATKHGRRFDAVYQVWLQMVQRCTNPNNAAYERYAGRGITVCRRWLKFENFYADMGDPPPGLSLERKDNDKGYCKSNCEWATRTAQNRNTRRNRMFFYKGKERCIAEIAEMSGVPYMRLYQRLVTRGQTVAEATKRKEL